MNVDAWIRLSLIPAVVVFGLAGSLLAKSDFPDWQGMAENMSSDPAGLLPICELNHGPLKLSGNDKIIRTDSGFDCTVLFQPGRDRTLRHALSMQHPEDGACTVLVVWAPTKDTYALTHPPVSRQTFREFKGKNSWIPMAKGLFVYAFRENFAPSSASLKSQFLRCVGGNSYHWRRVIGLMSFNGGMLAIFEERAYTSSLKSGKLVMSDTGDAPRYLGVPIDIQLDVDSNVDLVKFDTISLDWYQPVCVDCAEARN